MKLTYDVQDKPEGLKLITLASQQMLAILACTIAVPMIVKNGMTPAAAMFGAGAGSIIYLLFTKRKSPVFLGSSFAFLDSMAVAFAGSVSMQLGFLGLLLGTVFAGLVYCLLALIVKKIGVGWIDKIMPPVIIGPTVAIIGLCLAGNAVGDLQKGDVIVEANAELEIAEHMAASPYVALICGLAALFVVMVCSSYGKKMVKLIPFIIGILVGYVIALVLTVLGNATDTEALQLIDLSVFSSNMFPEGKASIETFFRVPDFVFIEAFKGIKELNSGYLINILSAYVPVAFVVFAEHVADHKNLSSIIGKDLIKDPGLSRTLLGDGIGSMVGGFFGGCPNTTYGESIACVAITGNASSITIFAAAIGCMICSFITPLVAFIDSIPSCVMGGVCMSLYGFIAVSGLKMLQPVNLGVNKNLFTVSVILIAGLGGLSLTFGDVKITNIATALVLGIITNLVLSKSKEE